MPIPGRHDMWGANYCFKVVNQFDAPVWIAAIIDGKPYRVIKLCWCTWYSSGEQSSLGGMILINGRLDFAEKQDEFEGYRYAEGEGGLAPEMSQKMYPSLVAKA
jgi:hypothetical protein